MYKFFFKPFIDFAAALLAVILFSPILVFITIVLLFQNNGKPFFFQERPGKDQRAFNVIKFKTMTDEKDEKGILLPDNQRMTKFGMILRNLSLDELPQLFNIIQGDMSLVGPRPLLFKYIPLYSQEQLRRHEVKPGITGWAQVNGRNSISWTKKLELDLEYVKKINFLLDLKIIALTVVKVLRREGINQTAARPMEPFNGKN